MGFYVQLPIFFPEEDGSNIVWRQQALIDFSRVTRLEKIVSPAYAHRKRSPGEEARIALVSCIMRNLFSEAETDVPTFLAPPFLLGDQSPKISLEFHPSLEDHRLAEHNAWLKKPPQLQRTFIKTKQNAVLHAPFFWISCRLLSSWLSEVKKKNGDEWRAIKKNATARALFNAQHDYLCMLASTKAQALFYCPL